MIDTNLYVETIRSGEESTAKSPGGSGLRVTLNSHRPCSLEASTPPWYVYGLSGPVGRGILPILSNKEDSMLATLRNLTVVSALLLFAASSGDALVMPSACERSEDLESCGGSSGDVCEVAGVACLSVWCDEGGVAIVCVNN